MQNFGQAFHLAGELVVSADSVLLEIIGLSLRVSLTAVFIACVIGLPIGAALAIGRFPVRGLVIVTVNALMGLPPVVVGLVVYMTISNAGPLGWLQLLYTPTAMIIAQIIIIFPIVWTTNFYITKVLLSIYQYSYDYQYSTSLLLRDLHLCDF